MKRACLPCAPPSGGSRQGIVSFQKCKTTKDLATLKSTASLADYKGKWLVLFFYPADFTFV